VLGRAGGACPRGAVPRLVGIFHCCRLLSAASLLGALLGARGRSTFTGLRSASPRPKKPHVRKTIGARPQGADRLEIPCSIHLSYGRVSFGPNFYHEAGWSGKESAAHPVWNGM